MDGHRGVDGLGAEPTPPAVAVTIIVELAHPPRLECSAKQDLTAATFAPHVGSTFAVDGAGELVLAAVLHGGPAPTPELRAPFALQFTGEPGMEQRIHLLEHAAIGALEIFLVPTGPTTYEAVFA